MARLDPRFRGDAIQPAHVHAPSECYDRLDGPLLSLSKDAGHDSLESGH